jgi:hypothetical protein
MYSKKIPLRGMGVGVGRPYKKLVANGHCGPFSNAIQTKQSQSKNGGIVPRISAKFFNKTTREISLLRV